MSGNRKSKGEEPCVDARRWDMDAHNSAILVPYHAWRISHRTHHANHGHVENDESWHPTTQSMYEKMDPTERMGRLSLPFAMMAYPFYLVRPLPPALIPPQSLDSCPTAHDVDRA